MVELEGLKIAILQATRPGDVVFFNVAAEEMRDQHHRELVVALGDYLRPMGITPVMLPQSIEVVGAVFDQANRAPHPRAGFNLKDHRPTCGLWDLSKPMVCTCKPDSCRALKDLLTPAELDELIDWHGRCAGFAMQSDDLAGERHCRSRQDELRSLRGSAPLASNPLALLERQNVELRAKITQLSQPKTCVYTRHEDNDNLWLSSCGNEFRLVRGLELLPFCAHCGGAIETETSREEPS